jgi:TRAP-type C4-dicarboxylate transport system substrate-binding protein
MLAFVLAACGEKAQDTPAVNQSDTPSASVDPTPDKTWSFDICFSHAEPVSANWARVFGPDLEAASGGRIKSNIYWGGSLAVLSEVPSALGSGTITIGNLPTPNFIDLLPLNCRILQLPFIGLQDPIKTADIYLQLLREFPEMEQELANIGIKVVGATPLGRYDLKLTFKDREVHLPTDLSGRTIVPYKNEFMSLLTANSVGGMYVPPVQIFETLEKGVAEGYIATWAYAGFFGLTDLVKQHVDFGEGGAFQELNLFAMSLDTWNELPKDLQQALTDLFVTNGGYKDIYHGDTEVLANGQKDAARAKGDIITTLTQEEYDVWKSAILPEHVNTINDINGIRGDDVAQKIYDRLLQLLA